jgi:hypothetical protein
MFNGVFLRVIGPEEKRIVEESGSVPVSRGTWYPYPPESVIFLFVDDDPQKGNGILERARENLRTSGAAYLLKIEGEIEVEQDKSGWAMCGAVVHHGPIDLVLVRSFIEEIRLQ